jgi:hypothetical protein
MNTIRTFVGPLEAADAPKHAYVDDRSDEAVGGASEFVVAHQVEETCLSGAFQIGSLHSSGERRFLPCPSFSFRRP